MPDCYHAVFCNVFPEFIQGKKHGLGRFISLGPSKKEEMVEIVQISKLL